MPNDLRIVFMGTPEFAVASLKHLHEEGMQIAGVITAPDKPAGRGKKITPPPVKEYARSAGIGPVLQPPNLKDPKFLEELKNLRADLQIVVAFRMLPEAVWSMPPKGTVNLHASLLPDYRGAAPINWTIINGENETGVTSFFIEKDIDTGKIIFQERVTIGDNMTAGELHDLLMQEGAQLLKKTIEAIGKDQYPAIPQNTLMQEGDLHKAPKIFKEDCRIDWNKPARKIYDLIRGLSPYPAAWTEIENGSEKLMMKILRTAITEEVLQPGELKTDNKTLITIGTGTHALSVLELQLAGKRRMKTDELLRGMQDFDNYRIVIA